MEPVWPKEVSSLPENIKVVDEADVVGVAGRGEPGVETKQTAEAAYPSAAGGGGARNKNSHLGL